MALRPAFDLKFTKTCKKVCYATKKKSKAAMRTLNKTKTKKRDYDHAYYCDQCSNWHLTSMSKWRANDYLAKNKPDLIMTEAKANEALQEMIGKTFCYDHGDPETIQKCRVIKDKDSVVVTTNVTSRYHFLSRLRPELINYVPWEDDGAGIPESPSPVNKEKIRERLREMVGVNFNYKGVLQKVIGWTDFDEKDKLKIHTDKGINEHNLESIEADLKKYERAREEIKPGITAQPVNTSTPFQAAAISTGRLNHVESNIKVYVTREYNIFKSITGNRLLNHNKIKKIIKEIEAGLNMLPFYPIVVDKDMNVIDGQHRLFIARQLKCNIWYIICEGKKANAGSPDVTLNDIAKVNSNTERWKNKDFIHCYAAQGNQHYIKLSDFSQTWSFDLTTSMVLLRGKAQDGSIDRDFFERGSFEVIDEDYANKIARQAHEFKTHEGFKKRAFEMKRKFDKNPELLTVQVTAKGYMKALEEVYNFHKGKREVLW